MPSSTTFRTRTGRLIPAVIVAMLLASCSSQAPQTPTETLQAKATGSSDYYLQQAQQNGDDTKADWQLLAVRALLREGKLPEAANQLAKLPQNLSAAQALEQQLVSAEVQIAQQNYPAAAATLSKLDPASLNDAQKARFYQAQIDVSQGRTSLGLLRAYIAQEPLLQGKPHQDNIDATWSALSQMTQQDVNSIAINADENTLQGWLDLLSVWQSNKQDPDLLKAGIKDWQRRYPVNPAAKNLPTQLNSVLSFQPSSTEKIALFLPMSGAAQVYGNAIQQGFNAAMNGLPSQPAPQQATVDANAAVPQTDPNAAVSPSAPDTTAAQGTPTDAAPSTAAPVVSATPVNGSAQVKVYDTSTQPLPVLLAQAQQDGATIVVGPLLKNKVTELGSIQTPLNVLALNQPETEKSSPNICYFALSPEDEAQDAARHMWAQHRQMPLLLVPRGSFGDRIAQAFADEWQKQGGQTVLKQGLGSYSELKSTLRTGIRLTGIPVSSSVQTAAPAQSGVTIGGITIPAPPSDDQIAQATSGNTSGNIDSVYIVATQDELTLIKPMIDLAVSGRNKPAVYASSRSYQAGAGPDYRMEMEGVQFSDIPLLAGNNPALMQQAASQFKNDYSLVRLYAMGIDAWDLANHFSQMRQIPGFQVSGTTGQLSANDNCVIHRKLPWLQYRQGSLVQVSS
ncbi:penicillin-binding protein activator [Hafnia psychrotolerans]|uniref:Penicillin-binding protein activator LpoA n=1 Tax=Hafnia psychrotolerans TaxID=1477018 RepID=A0ABQ1H7C8_9GAMM|nr:penicillin-binding protein activator [Hafnia psychrotolerans]GGA62125.1 penicillin-binding protein activator LpoA [Hafnia psychrotolerans]